MINDRQESSESDECGSDASLGGTSGLYTCSTLWAFRSAGLFVSEYDLSALEFGIVLAWVGLCGHLAVLSCSSSSLHLVAMVFASMNRVFGLVLGSGGALGVGVGVGVGFISATVVILSGSSLSVDSTLFPGWVSSSSSKKRLKPTILNLDWVSGSFCFS